MIGLTSFQFGHVMMAFSRDALIESLIFGSWSSDLGISWLDEHPMVSRSAHKLRVRKHGVAQQQERLVSWKKKWES